MELTGTQALIAVAVLIAGPGGAAWVAVRVGLNGARQDIRDIKASSGRLERDMNTTARTVERLDERSSDHERRIAWLEDNAA